MKILVLGAGLIGGPIAMDLAKDGEYEIISADISPEALNKLKGIPGISVRQADLGKEAVVRDLAMEADIVVNAVPGFMGYKTVETLIDCGKDTIDIAFFPEDMFGLDAKARAKDITVICDMGVAPGMSNVLLAYGASKLDTLEKGIIYVGGLPVIRTWPYEYKAVFSPIDVIEEYTRPARFIRDGKLVIKEALSDPELIDFSGVGTLEAFNSDGLRTLATTLTGDYIIEKTLRYPGHIEKMAVLRDTGFFSREPVSIGGTEIIPLDFTTKLLFPKWKLEKGEEDLTVMRIVAEGIKDGRRLSYTWDLLDRYDPVTGIHSMARTTGYAATMAVRMVASGLYSRKGVSAPEFIGRDAGLVSFMLEGLRRRGITYRETDGEGK